MRTENYMTKAFGASEITRELFEGLPSPICTDGITDKQMQELADSVEAEVRDRYREMFEDCFEQPINLENVSDSEMQKLSDEVESIVREKYPDEADTLFRLAIKVVWDAPTIEQVVEVK